MVRIFDIERHRRVRPLLVVIVALILATGCGGGGERAVSAREALGVEPAGYVEREAVGFALTTLPTSGVVVSGRTGAVCYSHKGDEEWRFEAPAGEEIVASPAVAPDSTTYILTSRSLVLLSIKGEIVWSIAIDVGDLPSVIALGDGTAVVTAGSNALENYEAGRKRWRFELPDGDTIASLPRAAANSRIFVQGAARVYVIDPSGVPVWDKPL